MYVPHLFTHSTTDGHLCHLITMNERLFFFLSILGSHVEVVPHLVIGYLDML